MIKRIVIIGSSGGGKANTSASEQIVHSIISCLSGFSGCQVTVTHVQFISCRTGLDFATNSLDASLFVYNEKSKSLQCSISDKLPNVNSMAQEQDSIISQRIISGEVDGIIAVSCNPGLLDGEGANKLACEAAIQYDIPIVGTGGTSISYLSSKGANIIGCSGGSVAATPQTRAICFLSSLAAYWRVGFSLNVAPIWPSFPSICGGILPILIANTLLKTIADSLLQQSFLLQETGIALPLKSWLRQVDFFVLKNSPFSALYKPFLSRLGQWGGIQWCL